jgi:nicotinamidase-related amidase
MIKNSALLVIDAQKVYSLTNSRLKVANIENTIENIQIF